MCLIYIYQAWGTVYAILQYIATCATRILQSSQCVRAQYCNIYGLAGERLPYIDHIRFPMPDDGDVVRNADLYAFNREVANG